MKRIASAAIVVLVCCATGAQEQKQHEARDCCRDLGYLQSAIIEAFNEDAKGKQGAAREMAMKALRETGLNCHWNGDAATGTPRLVCR